MVRHLLAASLVLAGLAGIATADDKKADDKADPGRSKRSEAQQCCYHAMTVNFSKELGVPLEYLSTLGNRISQARKTQDPVELAMAAQSLAVAEQLAGKKASITAESVLKEAVELAQLRGISTELAALAIIAPDDATKMAASKGIDAAKKREEARAAAKSGEDSREIHGRLAARPARTGVQTKYWTTSASSPPHRHPVQVVVPAGLPLADLAGQNATANLGP